MKKRIFSVLLVLCMLLSVCIAFSGCADLAAPSVKLSNAMEETAKQLTSSLPIDLLTKALSAGSVTVKYKDENDQNLSIKVFCDEKAGKFAFKVNGDIQNIKGDLAAYVSKDQYIFGSEEFLDNKNYGVSLKTLKDDFKSSVFANEDSDFYVGDDALEQVNTLIDTLTSTAMPDSAQVEKLLESYWDEFFSLLKKNDCVTESTSGGITTITVSIDEKKAGSIVKSMIAKIKSDAELKKLLTYFISYQSISKKSESSADLDDFYDQLDKLVEEIDDSDEEFTIEITADIVKKTKVLSAASLTVKDEDGDKLVDVDFVNTAEEVSFKVTSNGMKYTIKLTTDTDTKDTYEGKLTVSMKSGASNVSATADLSWDKKTGDYEIKADLGAMDESTKVNEYTISGNYAVTKDTAVLTITKFRQRTEYSDEYSNYLDNVDTSKKLDITVTIKATDTMPSFPEYKNVFKMTDDEIQEFSENLQKIGGSMIGGSENFPIVDDDYEY